MELIRYLTIVRRWLWLLVLATGIACLVALWVTQQQTVVYMAQAKLIVGPSVASADPDLNALRTGGQLMQTYAQLTTTGPILQAVVSELHLNTTPESLAQKIELKTDAETQIMTIRVRDGKSQQAAAIANALAEILVRVGTASSSNTQSELAAQMRADIDKFRQIAEESEGNIKQLQAQFQASDPEAQNSILERETNIKQLEVELSKPADPSIQQNISERETKIKQLETTLVVTMDLTARRLILDQITLEYNRLADAQSSESVRKRTLLDELAWERNRLEDLRKADADKRTSLRDQITQEQARQTEAQRNLAQVSSAVAKDPTNQLQIIERASAGSPVSTPLALTLVIAGIGGLVLALTIALTFEYFDNTLQVPEELADLPGIAVLGVIPKETRLQGAGRARLTVLAHPESRAAESYRILGTKLLAANNNTPLRSVLITSVQEGDDDPDIAANLGVTLAEMGKRVVLVDANLRCPGMSQLFGVPGEPGLTEMLAGTVSGVKPMALDRMSGFSIVPSGSAPSNPFELLASPHLINVVEEFERENDLVIIAAGPLLSCADSLLIASRVEGVILVIRAGHTRRNVLPKALESLQSLGAHIIGGVLSYNRPANIPRISPRKVERVSSKSTRAAQQQTTASSNP